MNFSQSIFLIFCSACTLLSFKLVGADDVKQSYESANHWLNLVDQGKYGDSWDSSAKTLQLKVPRDQWVQLMDNIRKPLGKALERKLLDQRPSKDPEDLPIGDYMVIYYSSSFENKTDAHELITLVQSCDKKWQVLTYQVQ